MNLSKKIILLITLSIIMISCVKIYEPAIESRDIANYVVSGLLTNEEGYQYVSVSKSSTITKPSDNQLSGCKINILDNNGNSYQLNEYENGKYRVWMNQSDLKIGSAYMLELTTPSNEKLSSDFEILTQGGQIDSVYYALEKIPTADNVPYDYIEGIRFFIDAHGLETSSRYYKWELTETWEYHVDHPIEWVYNGTIHHVFPPDSSKMICWRTITSGDIYVVSTDNLSKNEYKMASLSFVSNKTQRLKYLYSLLIKQYALSKKAYNYWQQLQLNNNQDGGLYTSQPIDIKGNIYNETNPTNEVLGYFGVSTVTQKRIFIQDVPNLEIDAPCCDTTFLRFGLRELNSSDYPAYLTGSSVSYSNNLLGDYCVDCVRLGGTTTKPDFWPY